MSSSVALSRRSFVATSHLLIQGRACRTSRRNIRLVRQVAEVSTEPFRPIDGLVALVAAPVLGIFPPTPRKNCPAERPWISWQRFLTLHHTPDLGV